MRIESTGEIGSGLYVTGAANVPSYLLDGPVPVLFDSGITALSFVYERDLKKILGGRSPGYLFLTHSHFDHVGSAGYFKSLWPDMKIVSSEKAADILRRPGAIELIKKLNQDALSQVRKTYDLADEEEVNEKPFEPFEVDLVIGSGEIVELGDGVTVRAIAAPGHTRDFMSYWIPEKKILVASEAGGYDDGTGYIFSEFLVDYDLYLESLNNLSKYDCEILCTGHRLVLTGSDTKSHMRLSREHADRYLDMVEGFLREEKGDIEKAVQRVKKAEWDEKPWPKQVESAYLLNTRVRVKTLRERMERMGESFPPRANESSLGG
jgi:glyoxylase-like metal-dependent hydrolase (beta-lactamase superfamily II)